MIFKLFSIVLYRMQCVYFQYRICVLYLRLLEIERLALPFYSCISSIRPLGFLTDNMAAVLT